MSDTATTIPSEADATPPPLTKKRPSKATDDDSFVWKIIRFFSSFGLATTILFFLFVITWLGTLEQIQVGLYDTQKKYFESLFLVHWAYGKIPLPLPGGALLLSLLFLNIVCGGIIRLRKKPQTAGVLTAHLSIAFLILAGGIEFMFKKEGNMALWPGESSNTFMKYHDWVLEISELEKPDSDVWVIRDTSFNDLKGTKSRIFFKDGLPFELKLFGYLRNCKVAAGGSPAGQPVLDGFYLDELAVLPSNEQNVGGVLCEVKGKDGKKLDGSVLTPMTNHPFTFEAGGRKFAITMGRERWQVPFTVKLDKFVHEVYPNSTKPKVFRSEIRRIEDGAEEPVKISMNEPMRHGGYTFFQASWGPEDAMPDEDKFTVFAVVKNPSDNWPLWACIAAFAGLAFHFGYTLIRHVRRINRKSTETESTPDPQAS